jgi:hypothetical protein
MPHHVDGFELKFTSRTSWKAKLRLLNQKLDVVPVTLSKRRRQGSRPKKYFSKFGIGTLKS